MKPFLHYLTLWGAGLLAMLFLMSYSINAFLLPFAQHRNFGLLVLQLVLSGVFAYFGSSRFDLSPEEPGHNFRQVLSSRPFRRWALAAAIPTIVALYALLSPAKNFS